MGNKFRQRGDQQIAPKQRQEKPEGDLTGHDSSKSPALLPLTGAAKMEHVVMERGELRKDLGWGPLGEGVGTIIGLIEHKWQFGGELYSRILRIFNDGGVTRTQYWNGAAWVESAQASEPMLSVYLSQVSIQGCLLVADGQRIMRWCEEIQTDELFHDFVAGQNLEAADECSDDVSIFPAGALDNEYTINLGIDWTGIPGEDTIAEILVKHNGIEFTRRLYSPATIDAVDEEVPDLLTPEEQPEDISNRDVKAITIRRVIASDDTLSVCVGSDSSAGDVESIVMTLGDVSTLVPANPPFIPDPIPVWQYLASKSWPYGFNDALEWDFHFTTRIPAGTGIPQEEILSVNLYAVYLDADGVPQVLFDEYREYVNSTASEEIVERVETVLVINGPPRVNFSLSVNNAGCSAGVLEMPFTAGPITGPKYVEVVGSFTAPLQGAFSIHPFNLPEDGDRKHGITYRVATGVETTFRPLSDDAPAARYIFSFGDRVIALQDFGDRQALSWSADGLIEEWAEPDSGRVYLLDAQIDPIDDLMAGAHVGGANFALYRKRSIWRGFETGSVEQAIGVVPWIAGIGTDCRFSVQIVPGGNIFLGSDSMVYILTESGQLTGVGGPIREDLIKHLTAENITVDLDLVDSLFDSTKLEYWLMVPEDGAEFVTAIWIFNLGLFMREQKIDWRKRPMPQGVRRAAVVSTLPME